MAIVEPTQLPQHAESNENLKLGHPKYTVVLIGERQHQFGQEFLCLHLE